MHWIYDLVILSLTAIAGSGPAAEAEISHGEPPSVGVLAALAAPETQRGKLSDVFEPAPTFSSVEPDTDELLEPRFGTPQARAAQLRGVVQVRGTFGQVQPLGRIGFPQQRIQ